MSDEYEYTCDFGHRHKGPCLSTHGGSGGTRNGMCEFCHLMIIDGVQQLPREKPHVPLGTKR